MVQMRLRTVIDLMIGDETYRYRIQTMMTTLLFGVIGMIMFTINVVTQTVPLVYITAVIMVVGYGLSAYVHYSGKYKGPRVAVTAVFIGALISFMYNGGIDGFSPFWAYLLPFLAFFMYGLRRGFYVAGTMMGIMCLMLWTPIAGYLSYNYTTTFIMRYPMLYLGCLMSAFVMEFTRDRTMKKLNDTVAELEGITRIDALTGIENRRAFQARIDELWEIFHGKDNYMTLLMVDIDFFKKYNDNYGHLKGDEILKQVAVILSENAHGNRGFVSRWGGEEFVCLLPFTDSKQAVKAAEQMRSAIEAADILHEYTDLDHKVITVSIGTATVNATLGIHPRELIQEADQSLYEAKSFGRNRLGRNRTLG